MSDRVKTSLFINRELWGEFKLRVGARAGSGALSRAVEELLEEGVAERVVVEELSRMLSGPAPLEVKPVKPRVPMDAGRAVRELRGGRGA
jgi:hypothetical protein